MRDDLDPIKLEIMTGNISRILPAPGENGPSVDLAVNSLTFEDSSRNLEKMISKENRPLK